jgi:D-alanyl-lipoteichoic acid acyltransferase DltB (MBOAT superfamily)
MVFFPIVVFLYFFCPQKYRWALLLGASYYFYMAWRPEYALLIFITTLTTYLTAIAMSKAKDKYNRKKYLILNIVFNLGILFLFKYFNFFSGILNQFLLYFTMRNQVSSLDLLLPVGISFYTFQALGYSIDVYRGEVDAEKHFGIFALFLSFFPQLVAGPIERSRNLLPQFHRTNDFDMNNVKAGFAMILWGLFKKIVIADKTASIVNIIYNNPQEYSGIPLIMGTVLFAFQIYCDFSGYSDIAIGCAKILGFELMENFDSPYTATSISRFWRKWHKSLSTWFKDYLYIPLGGNRVSKTRFYINQFIVFLFSGLWHGANITFVIWGMLHGFYMIFSNMIEGIKNKLGYAKFVEKAPIVARLVSILVVFALVDFAWIFFRANSINDANYIVSNLFSGIGSQINSSYLSELLIDLNVKKFDLMMLVIFIVFVQVVESKFRVEEISKAIADRPFWLRYGFYYLIIFAIILFGGYGCEENTQFIYFQF